MTMKPVVTISYCPACHWLPRSTWMAQELLHTFVDELELVALRPSSTPGEFIISVDGEPIWNRKKDGGFPDIQTLKQRVRDRVAPGRDLKHIDRNTS